MSCVAILSTIEALRKDMYHIANVKGSVDDLEVLAASKELDLALNKYYQLKSILLKIEASV